MRKESTTRKTVSKKMPRRRSNAPASDSVNHPKHYNSHPSGVECITITEHMNFNLGNAVKYIWRGGLKDEAPTVRDLQKARWYIDREIARVTKT
jgi:hypothetical protein